MPVFVISKTGEKLMPTVRYGRVRHLLKSGRAVIYSRNPFTIQLTYDASAYTQPIEVCQDTGYQHIGLSVKNQAREYVSAQYDLLPDEKQKHDACRKYRRARRSRKRYRKPRFCNRKSSKKPGWISPSLKNKADRHVDLIMRVAKVAPVTSVTIEMGEFDIQLLKAVSEGKPIPEGVDYQRGPRYGIETLRAAVFQRDGHKCIFCGRGLKEGAVLHVHHLYFWKGQHGNSLSELGTCCEKCHTSANHKEGGKLWGYDEKLPQYNSATFMNTVRWYIYSQLKKKLGRTPLHMTYGAATKLARKDLGIEKSHVNDAYAMGAFHPAARARAEYFQKLRRNNRSLEKFYDAKYIDIRDGERKSGAELGCQRTNRREPRNSDKSLCMYHGKKVSKGRRPVRKARYSIQPGDVLLFKDKIHAAVGSQQYGRYVVLDNKKSVPAKQVRIIYHAGGWRNQPPPVGIA